DPSEGLDLLGVEFVEQVPANRLHMPRGGGDEGVLALVGEDDPRAATVLAAIGPSEQAALLHAGQLVRQPALLHDRKAHRPAEPGYAAAVRDLDRRLLRPRPAQRARRCPDARAR